MCAMGAPCCRPGEPSAAREARGNAYDNAGAGWQGVDMPPLPRALPAPDGGASAVVDDLARGLAAALDGDLLGLYVHGSLVAGDFSPARSDLDLLAVLRTAPDEAVLAAVVPVHESLERRHPAWRGRVEVETVGLPTVVAVSAGSSAALSGPWGPHHAGQPRRGAAPAPCHDPPRPDLGDRPGEGTPGSRDAGRRAAATDRGSVGASSTAPAGLRTSAEPQKVSPVRRS